jgi:hypothetical protein
VRRFAITEGQAPPWEKRARWLSAPPLLLTTAVPVAIAAAIFIGAAIWWQSTHHHVFKSVAGWEACLATNGYSPTSGSLAVAESSGVASKALSACRSVEPDELVAAGSGQGTTFSQCMSSLGQSSGGHSRGFGGFGRFGGGGFHRPPAAFFQAFATCRGLLSPEGGPGRPITTTPAAPKKVATTQAPSA